MHREKFPEKIPFRLTRMLVHAMEVTGIEGTNTFVRTSSFSFTLIHLSVYSYMYMFCTVLSFGKFSLGNYRLTCEYVMSVLRAHRDSIIAVLEAFVYDPLLNWRLIDSMYCLLTFIIQYGLVRNRQVRSSCIRTMLHFY